VGFPIENRHSPQSLEVIQQHLDKSPTTYETLADFHLLIYLAKLVDSDQIKKIAKYVLTKQNEQDITFFLAQLLKGVQKSTPVPSKSTTPSVSKGKHPQEQEWLGSLKAMGFSATQAQEALWATSYQGIEAAIDFLSR